MRAFVYEALPGRVVFGPGTLSTLAEELDRLGVSRVLLIADGMAKIDADTVEADLGSRVVARIGEIQPHVPLEEVEAARKVTVEARVDALVTIGGGSTTGLGKAIILEHDAAFAAVPTTYAGSEMTPIYGVTAGEVKRTGRDPRVKPGLVVYDVDLTMGLPAAVTAGSVMNAMAHCVEALYALERSPIVSISALEGVKSLKRGAEAVAADSLDRDGRSDLQYGAYLAGASLGAVGMAIHHRICHVLGGTFGLAHGDANAVILPYAVAYNRQFEQQVMGSLASALAVAEPATGLRDLAEVLGAPTSLAGLGMTHDDVELAADMVVEAGGYNPRPIERSWVRQLLEEAYAGEPPFLAGKAVGQTRTRGGIVAQDGNSDREVERSGESGTSRRDFLRMAGMGGAAVIGGSLLAACADDAGTTSTTGAAGASSTSAAPGASTTAGSAPTGRPIKIGYVSPTTGPIAAFGEADEFVLQAVNARLADGITVAGTVHPVEIVTRDSESDPVVAGTVAGELILDEAVDLMVVASTPETTNPVADQCEINGVPCVSTVAPWQPWFFGRGGDPATGFTWTYHYFWGLETLIPQFITLWDKLETNKVVGGLFPNDGDGQAWGDPELGFPPALEAAGYTIIDPGRYENLSDDFSAQIAAFSDGGAEIITGVPLPPDFATFWTQAAQQGLTPSAATIGKAILFPAAVEALDGDSGDGLTSEVWWSPGHPFTSSLTQENAETVAQAYTTATGRQWTQPIGFVHSLFEVAADVLTRTQDIEDKQSILDAVSGTNLETLVGPVNWTATGPVPNVSTTPLVGGQWVLGGDFKYDLVIVDNSQTPAVPLTGEIKPIGG